MNLIERLREVWDPTGGLQDLPVLRLGDPLARDAQRVGGKAANLSRLATRWPVPPGFCLPVEFHGRLVERGRPPTAVSVRRLITPAYRELAGTSADDPPVAVRSSAIDEDAADASFAGQYDTVLNARGVEAVAEAVLTCCASARSEQVDVYRETHGLEAGGAMAVLVQELIDAEVSGVVFSANPVTGDRDEVMINASFGLGEAIVDGIVTPDTYLLTRDGDTVLDREIADKDVQIVCDRVGTRRVQVEPERRGQPTLDVDRCRELTLLAVELEEHMGWPVDLEYAYRDGELFLLQCRPITSLPSS